MNEMQLSMFEILNRRTEAPAEPARPLSLDELNALKPFTAVWLENRWRWAVPVREDDALSRFYRLFQAEYRGVRTPLRDDRTDYSFTYFYNNVKYNHCRVSEFYGSEWRVWLREPTPAEMESEPWQGK